MHRLVRSAVVIGVALAALGSAEVALAAPGDQWQGQGSIVTTGTLTPSTGPDGVYTGVRMTFKIANLTANPVVTYTLTARGTWVTANPSPEFADAFVFRGRPVLKNSSGSVICSGGELVWGGGSTTSTNSSVSTNYGMFQFAGTCPVFHGWQFFRTNYANGATYWAQLQS
jgi:hypothetical protein